MNILKVIALSSVLTYSALVCANEIPVIDVQKLDGQYLEPTGSATASVWKLPENQVIHNAKFSVSKEQDVFIFSGDAGEFTLEGLPESILNMEKLNWRGAELQTPNGRINLSLSSLSGQSAAQSLNILKLNLECKGSSATENIRDTAIEVCLNSSTIEMDLFESSETSKSQTWVKNLLSTIATNTADSRTRFEDLQMNVSNGNFNFKVKAQLDISAKLKGEGKITLVKVSDRTELKIRLDKVKAGFFNVTKKVFEAIEDVPADGVRIERPYIIFELD